MDSFLRKVSLFAGLADADLEHLAQVVQEVRLPAGEVLFLEGSPGDRAFIIKEGQIEVLKASAGREVLLSVRGPSDVIGEMALLEDTPRTATIRARTDTFLLAIGKEQFDHLLSTSDSAARAMFHIVLERWRNTEAVLRHSERMAQLGTMTAGVAHELNNPAAAVKRSVEQLREAMSLLAEAQRAVGRLRLGEEQQRSLEVMAQQARSQSMTAKRLDSVTRSDREHAVETWLEQRGVEDGWEIAPALVDLGGDDKTLAELARGFSPPQLGAVLHWISTSHEADGLMEEISVAAGRISDIVKALKSYSYLDQAPVQTVDVHEGLENSLLILRHKLKGNITVRREYAPDLPKIEAYGSELNQVWTNIVDNAADALEGRKGTITLRTRAENDGVVVEIEDDGPGIPREIQPRIFDTFFTTKPPGKGTGLGLNITYNIVVDKHRGDIKVSSEPGKTCFQVWLPVNFEARGEMSPMGRDT